MAFNEVVELQHIVILTLRLAVKHRIRLPKRLQIRRLVMLGIVPGRKAKVVVGDVFQGVRRIWGMGGRRTGAILCRR